MRARSEKVEFEGRGGRKLAGRLELPLGEPAAFALFAHCFTCGKDVVAASRIARELAARGLAVLRFDFTGLGGSDGEFGNEGFSSDVEDLVRAAAYLRDAHAAPRLLIGHSLGGAAVLVAARRIERALAGDLERVWRDGEGEVRVADRPFRIRREFLEDVRAQDLADELARLRKPLLLLHSPVDRVVGIDHARAIYEAARGVKSFVSLDDADHLLTDRRDARYAAEVIAAWASRYVAEGQPSGGEPAEVEPGEVRVEEVEPPFETRVVAGRHVLTADEPTKAGGSDRGPSPYGLLLAALGACTSMTLRMYAGRKEWPLDGVAVRLRHRREHAADCEDCEGEGEDARIDVLEREIELEGDLDDEQRERLLEIANRCPVHRTLLNEKRIPTRLMD